MDDPYPSIMLLAEISSVSASYIFVNALIFVFLLLASGLVSGSEVAFFSLTSEDLESIQDSDDARAARAISLVESPKDLLSTVLILNNLINIGMVTLTTFVAWTIFGFNATGIVIILAQTIGVTFAIVFFGEIVPKVYATQANVKFSLLMAPYIYFFPWFSSRCLFY